MLERLKAAALVLPGKVLVVHPGVVPILARVVFAKSDPSRWAEAAEALVGALRPSRWTVRHFGGGMERLELPPEVGTAMAVAASEEDPLLPGGMQTTLRSLVAVVDRSEGNVSASAGEELAEDTAYAEVCRLLVFGAMDEVEDPRRNLSTEVAWEVNDLYWRLQKTLRDKVDYDETQKSWRNGPSGVGLAAATLCRLLGHTDILNQHVKNELTDDDSPLANRLNTLATILATLTSRWFNPFERAAAARRFVGRHDVAKRIVADLQHLLGVALKSLLRLREEAPVMFSAASASDVGVFLGTTLRAVKACIIVATQAQELAWEVQRLLARREEQGEHAKESMRWLDDLMKKVRLPKVEIATLSAARANKLASLDGDQLNASVLQLIEGATKGATMGSPLLALTELAAGLREGDTKEAAAADRAKEWSDSLAGYGVPTSGPSFPLPELVAAAAAPTASARAEAAAAEAEVEAALDSASSAAWAKCMEDPDTVGRHAAAAGLRARMHVGFQPPHVHEADVVGAAQRELNAAATYVSATKLLPQPPPPPPETAAQQPPHPPPTPSTPKMYILEVAVDNGAPPATEADHARNEVARMVVPITPMGTPGTLHWLKKKKKKRGARVAAVSFVGPHWLPDGAKQSVASAEEATKYILSVAGYGDHLLGVSTRQATFGSAASDSSDDSKSLHVQTSTPILAGSPVEMLWAHLEKEQWPASFAPAVAAASWKWRMVTTAAATTDERRRKEAVWGFDEKTATYKVDRFCAAVVAAEAELRASRVPSGVGAAEKTEAEVAFGEKQKQQQKKSEPPRFVVVVGFEGHPRSWDAGNLAGNLHNADLMVLVDPPAFFEEHVAAVLEKGTGHGMVLTVRTKEGRPTSSSSTPSNGGEKKPPHPNARVLLTAPACKGVLAPWRRDAAK